MTAAHETGNRRVTVDGIVFAIAKDTPDPLPPEVLRDLQREAAQQKEAWAKQEQDLAAARRSWDQPAKRDADGGMITEGRLEGDDPIVQEDVDAADEPIDEVSPAAAVRDFENRARTRPRGAPGEIEDITAQQEGWRP